MIDLRNITDKQLAEKIAELKETERVVKQNLTTLEKELEKRKQEVPLGVPIGGAISRSFLLWFQSNESADKFDNEYFNNFVKALQDIANGNPIDIEVLLPLMKKGYVAMDKDKRWYWYEEKPTNYEDEDEWISVDGCFNLFAFNIKPAKDWRKSLMECGL